MVVFIWLPRVIMCSVSSCVTLARVVLSYDVMLLCSYLGHLCVGGLF